MPEYRYAVETADETPENRDRFLFGHAAPMDVGPLSPSEIRVVSDRKVDQRVERYSGDPAAPRRAATQPEIDAYDAAATSARVIAEVDAPIMAALVDSVAALVAEHGPGSGDEWSASDLRQHVIDTLTPLL